MGCVPSSTFARTSGGVPYRVIARGMGGVPFSFIARFAGGVPVLVSIRVVQRGTQRMVGGLVEPGVCSEIG